MLGLIVIWFVIGCILLLPSLFFLYLFIYSFTDKSIGDDAKMRCGWDGKDHRIFSPFEKAVLGMKEPKEEK